jgi:hypothetical protein
MSMDNAAEQYLISGLDGFRGIEGEIGQGHSIDEQATDSGQMGRLRKLLASLQRWVAQLRRSAIT